MTDRDRDLAPVAALIGDPARAAILTALADGRARPAGELARLAGIRPATASAHLRRLVEGGLVRVRQQGRHRYHELAGAQVAQVLEALAALARPAPVRSLRQHRSALALVEARTCYDHLAGRRGVQLREKLLAVDALRPVDDRDHVLTARGGELLSALRVDPDQVTGSRRVFARCCVDWTDRRPHLAGALPVAVINAFFDHGWLARGSGRELRVAEDYDDRLDRWLAGRQLSRKDRSWPGAVRPGRS